MTFEDFSLKFDLYIFPRIEEIKKNNPYIQVKNLYTCKKNIFCKYDNLKSQYKNIIFNKSEESILDRHKIASCICGATLSVPIFDKTDLIKKIIADKKTVESYLYYVNEFISFYTGIVFLGMFMVYDNKDDFDRQCHIIDNFPVIPKINKSKKGFIYNVLFNLSQIIDDKQIGIERYDMYAYAMIYYLLETHYNIIYPKKDAFTKK